MKKRKLFFAISLVLSIVIIAGCSAKSIKEELTRDAAPSQGASENEAYDNSKYGIATAETAEEEYYEPDKIITTVYISMETLEFDETTKKLDELIKKYKGYVENSDISHNNYIYSSGLKFASYTIRIPQENIENFVNDIKGIGNIISENTSKEDITKKYRDTESRLRVLETKEKRILALLEKAEKMEDIITLENQLAEVIYEKEKITASLMEMDDKVNYSTVNLEIREVAKLTSRGNEKTPFSAKVSNAFKESIYYFTRNIENLIVSIIYILPYVIIIGIVVYIIKIFIKRRNIKFPKIGKKDGE